MNRLRRALIDGAFLLDLQATDIASVLRAGLDFVEAKGLLDGDDRKLIEETLIEREQTDPTAIGNSVAIPHAYSDKLTEPIILFIRLRNPLNFDAPDGVAVRYVFLLLGPPGAAEQHLDALAGIARLMSDDQFRYEAGIARTQLDLIGALQRFQERNQTRKKPKEPIDDGLVYTGKFGGGLFADLKRRLPHYVSDYTDGLNAKSIASVLFLFFACLAPAVTFGGIMAQLTGNQIGVVEMLVATAACGILYAVFSGQPLILLGGTGPLLIFTWVLYVLCQKQGLDGQFLEVYAWVGIWTAILLLLMAATDASCLMRYVTRFTDETFGALMSIIFIYTALKALWTVVNDSYASNQTGHDEALVPLLLTGGTFYIAMSLSRFRRSHYLIPPVREFLADFGPAIAISIMTVLAITWFGNVAFDTLEVGKGISPSIERSWFVNPLNAPMWIWFASIIPAIFAALLIFIVQNVTARLINSPENHLQKGPAYHLDLAVIGLLVGVCSLFGLPWFVAATVRSLNQFRSLAEFSEVVTKDGGTRERIIHVSENRVTPLAIHIAIGVSLLFLPLLNYVPMAVLYGLFLYMGVASMAGNQFIDRLTLLITDPSLYPSDHYIRQVPNRLIHLFTSIQFVSLLALTILQFSSFAILLPLALVLLIPIRMGLGRLMPPESIAALDGVAAPDEEETHWT